MADFRTGDSRAGGQLVELLYPELKRIAAGQMGREWSEHSWQPTLLVNELYLDVLKIKGLPPQSRDPENDKAAFLAIGGQVLKRLLIHHARPLSKRVRQVPLEEDLPLDVQTGILELEHLLSRLAKVKPEIRTVAELKVFQEIAARLCCATVTVNRYWQFARRWLREELEGL